MLFPQPTHFDRKRRLYWGKRYLKIEVVFMKIYFVYCFRAKATENKTIIVVLQSKKIFK
jgi:hypothetical protein